MKIFRRSKYLDKILSFLEKEKLILLLGPRQVGKTTLLYMLKNEVKDRLVYYYSFEDEFSKLDFLNKQDFINYFTRVLKVDFFKPGLFLLDEIQYVKNNIRLLKALYDDQEIKLQFVVTGSWIWNLKEDSSSLVGRWVEIFIWWFDFFEFLEYKWLNVSSFSLKDYSSSLAKVFWSYYEEYLTFWGYPAVVVSSSKEEKILNLEKIVKKYIDKDISFMLSWEEIIDFKKFFSYFVSQIWNLVKVESVANFLWIKTKKVKKFLEVLKKTLFIQLCYPFYVDKQKEYSSHPKVYFHDIGILNFLKKNFDYIDFWIANEHFVANELLKNKIFNSDEIKIYKKISKSEIDFIYDGLTKFIPIETKSNNSLAVPKIFYSFDKMYWNRVSFYVKTTKDILGEKEVNWKKVYFVPNFLIGKILNF